jgi:hypothetical protein
MKFGKIQQVYGTGLNFFVVIPNEVGASSIVILEEQQSLFSVNDIGTEVEYEVLDIGHEFFKKGHYQPWYVAKVIMYQNA